VNDVRNARYDVLQDDGGFVTSFRRKVGSYGYRWAGGVDQQGSVYEQDIKAGPIDRTPGLKQARADLFLLRLDTASRQVDTLPLPRRHQRFLPVSARQQRRTVHKPAALEFDARGYVWVARTKTYRIYQTELRGDTMLVGERAYEPLPVTAADRASAIKGIESFMDRPAGRTTLDYSAIPDVKPALGAMDVDDQGRLWVRPVTDAEGTSFDIYDTVRMSHRHGPRAVPHLAAPTGFGGREHARVRRVGLLERGLRRDRPHHPLRQARALAPLTLRGAPTPARARAPAAPGGAIPAGRRIRATQRSRSRCVARQARRNRCPRRARGRARTR
jgi:hypothetical protein